ncbi:coenzyme F420-0:L-glutamate ligase [Siccirubricoccus sp. KC 17139]|uniref:Coenzyme F420-0:L-glutamate ligase n=1 Tax=Siccirubricoccus soli TaxID=2899147 RepID=A0ABT1D4N2_9PROT|nr:coenzyme F420-0:L-glutamate ligase [Siccirubricoccus soli]MCP2682717.1 coenzyme F420-0:L-glutamate ligase [Siccirubricoccus soli]
MQRLELHALPGLPPVQAGDDLAALIAAGLARAGLAVQPGDVLVVAQKIVSKAEGRAVRLAEVEPSPRAIALGAETGKDPRLVELILRDAVRIVRSRPNLIIVEHRLGFVMANGGLDQSNVVGPEEEPQALLLPVDPDGSAAALSATLGLPVVISDSFGRAWRRGTVGVAIGAAGLPSLVDLRGQPDMFGRTLHVSLTGFADEIAAAAGLLMGQGAEAQPVVLLRGLAWSAPANPASTLVRPAAEDLFR